MLAALPAIREDDDEEDGGVSEMFDVHKDAAGPNLTMARNSICADNRTTRRSRGGGDTLCAE